MAALVVITTLVIARTGRPMHASSPRLGCLITAIRWSRPPQAQHVGPRDAAVDGKGQACEARCLVGLDVLRASGPAPPGRDSHDLVAERSVGGQHAIVDHQMSAWRRHESRETGEQIERCEQHLGAAILEGMLQRVADAAAAEALLGDRRSSNVPARALQAYAVRCSERRYDLTLSLAPGRYVIEARSRSGRRGTAEVDVSAETNDDAAVEFAWH
ncbi:MAG: hypothetical protein U1E76_14820 [Planctomycetota bacterium]